MILELQQILRINFVGAGFAVVVIDDFAVAIAVEAEAEAVVEPDRPDH